VAFLTGVFSLAVPSAPSTSGGNGCRADRDLGAAIVFLQRCADPGDNAGADDALGREPVMYCGDEGVTAIGGYRGGEDVELTGGFGIEAQRIFLHA
jgi:hypothetical protein